MPVTTTFFPTTSPSGNTCGANSTSCTFEINLPGSTGQTLDMVKIRFDQLMGDAGFLPIDELDQNLSSVLGVTQIHGSVGPGGSASVNGCTVSQSATALAARGYELDVSLMAARSTALGKLTIQAGGAGQVVPTDDFTPFSFEFDYSDETTSLAAFDQSGNGVFSASAVNPITVGNSVIASEYPNGPPIYVATDPADFNNQSDYEDDNNTLPVPEPSSLALLGTFGLLSLAFRRRVR